MQKCPLYKVLIITWLLRVYSHESRVIAQTPDRQKKKPKKHHIRQVNAYGATSRLIYLNFLSDREEDALNTCANGINPK